MTSCYDSAQLCSLCVSVDVVEVFVFSEHTLSVLFCKHANSTCKRNSIYACLAECIVRLKFSVSGDVSSRSGNRLFLKADSVTVTVSVSVTETDGFRLVC